MGNFTDLERCREYMANAVARSGLSLSDASVDLLAEGLLFANDEVAWRVRSLERHRDAHDRAERKIELLEQLIAAYGPDRGAETSFQSPSLSHFMFQAASGGKPLEPVLDSLTLMVNAERAVLADTDCKAPTGRPTSAAMEGAEMLFRILCDDAQMSVWEACEFIAQVFVEIGLETRAQAKVQASLYDKLNRLR